MLYIFLSRVNKTLMNKLAKEICKKSYLAWYVASNHPSTNYLHSPSKPDFVCAQLSAVYQITSPPASAGPKQLT